MKPLAEALAEHLPLRGGTACECGWSAGLSLNDTRSDAKQHLRHLAAVVAEWLESDEAVGVLQDAADDVGVTLWRSNADAILAALAAHAKGETS